MSAFPCTEGRQARSRNNCGRKKENDPSDPCVISTMSNAEHDISWALKLLEREQDYEPNFIAQNWSYIWSTLFGIVVPVGMNYWLRRPIWAGIHQHFIGGGIGFGVGHLITERERFVLARRDAIFRDYIKLHPEDFPPPDRKKFGELFLPWVPIR